MTDHRTPRGGMYNRWRSMLRRCENPTCPQYPDYGGRGIRVCERWQTFEAYLADVGFPPSPELTVDRIDNDGDYAPDNVRWATRSEQRRNQRPRTYKYTAPCGTQSGYNRHLVRGEETCAECRAAHACGVRRRKATWSQTCEQCEMQIRGGNLLRHMRRRHPELVAA